MTTMIKPAPVRRAIEVQAPVERAFELFTAGIGSWWPATHSIGASPLRTPVIEPRAGGRWYEIGEDGSECEWGEVLAWEPPARLVLAWRLDAEWRFDPHLLTEVEVTFEPVNGKTTRVELEHRKLENMGASAEAARASLDGDGGWMGLLQRFSAAA